MAATAATSVQFILPSRLPTVAELANPETLRTLVAWGRLDTLKQLNVDLAAFVDDDKNTLLHVAARHAQPAVVMHLREVACLAASLANADGKSPLDLAAALPVGRFNRAETIDALTVPVSAKAPPKKLAKK